MRRQRIYDNPWSCSNMLNLSRSSVLMVDHLAYLILVLMPRWDSCVC